MKTFRRHKIRFYFSDEIEPDRCRTKRKELKNQQEDGEMFEEREKKKQTKRANN